MSEITMDTVRDLIERHSDHISGNTREFYNGAYAEIADELNATLGSDKPPYDELLRCLENDWHISASWDGLRKFWCIELTEEGVRLRDAELNSRAERACECIVEYAKSPLDGKTIVLHRCSSCNELMRPHMNYCPNCGARVKK